MYSSRGERFNVVLVQFDINIVAVLCVIRAIIVIYFAQRLIKTHVYIGLHARKSINATLREFEQRVVLRWPSEFLV